MSDYLETKFAVSAFTVSGLKLLSCPSTLILYRCADFFIHLILFFVQTEEKTLIKAGIM